jgi:hypothetical protein
MYRLTLSGYDRSRARDLLTLHCAMPLAISHRRRSGAFLWRHAVYRPWADRST